MELFVSYVFVGLAGIAVTLCGVLVVSHHFRKKQRELQQQIDTHHENLRCLHEKTGIKIISLIYDMCDELRKTRLVGSGRPPLGTVNADLEYVHILCERDIIRPASDRSECFLGEIKCNKKEIAVAYAIMEKVFEHVHKKPQPVRMSGGEKFLGIYLRSEQRRVGLLDEFEDNI